MQAHSDIDTNYARVCSTAGDIHEHLPILYNYAKASSSIAEFGVRSVVSTWAFLRGLRDNGASTKQLLCVDIEDVPALVGLASHLAREGIQLTFLKADTAKCSIPKVDTLFIDTWHVYGHLKRELAAHHEQVQRYIIMHDTEVDKEVGESIRMGYDIDAQVRDFGYSREEIMCGLQRALDEFLDSHKDEWQVAAQYTNNNGLTILERKGQPGRSPPL